MWMSRHLGGTVFESSKIPLRKWLVAYYLLCSSKKGMSAHQLYRMLDLGSYRTAWFMCHRIRYAMRDAFVTEKFTGTVEADETYIGGKAKNMHKAKRERLGIVRGRPGPACHAEICSAAHQPLSGA